MIADAPARRCNYRATSGNINNNAIYTGIKQMPSSEWHWEQGTKFATEAIKAGLLLNGAAAIALMTFANNHDLTTNLAKAVRIFALGAGISFLAFFAAFMSQRDYGNAVSPTGKRRDRFRGAV